MAVEKVTSVGRLFHNLSNKTASLTVDVLNQGGGTYTPVTADERIILVVSCDNPASTTAPTITFTNNALGITGWTLLAGPTGQGVTTTAGSGIWLWTYISTPTSGSLVGNGVLTTINFSTSVVAKQAAAHAFRGMDPAAAPLRGTVATGVSAAGTPAATTTGTAPATGDLVIGAWADEDVYTFGDGNDTDTLNGTWLLADAYGSTGGSAASNIGAGFHYKIVTAGGHQTFNPASLALDSAVQVFALIPPSGPPPQQGAAALTAVSTLTAMPSLDPLDPATMAGWYDADDPSSFTYSSGVAVSQWADKSGQGRHLTQSTPALQPSRNGVKNGHTSLVFANDGYLDSVAPFTEPQPLTVFMAMEVNRTSTQGWFGSKSGNFQIYVGAGSLLYLYAGLGPGGLAVGTVTPGSNVFTFEANGASSNVRRDGTLLATGDIGSAGTTTGWRTAERDLTLNHFLNCPVYEIIVYDRALSDTDKATVENYLTQKWLVAQAPVIAGSAALTATSTLTASGIRVPQAAVSLSATSTLTAMAVRAPQATAAFTAFSTLTVSAVRQPQAAASLTAISTLTATGVKAAGGVTAYRVLDDFTPPTNVFHDANPITVSMEFYVDADGCTATKAYFPNSGRVGDTWTMRLWRVDSPTTGTVLATKTSSAILAGDPIGWLPVTFDTPVSLVANQRYRISGTPTSWYYAATVDWWRSPGPGAAGIVKGPLHAPESGTPQQGQYVYATNGFPTESFNGGNYWIDVEVEQAGAGTKSATAALVATSILTATAVREPQAAVSLVATSTLSTTGVRAPQASAALVATSTLTATAVRVPQATAALVATSTLTVTSVRVPQAAASLIATSTLAATGVLTQFAAAALTSVSTLGVAGVREPQAAVSLVAVSTLSVTALRVVPASAALTAVSTLTSEAVGVGVISASASLTATSTLTAGAVREPQAAASLVSTSTLTVTATRTQLATAALTASSTLTASAVREPQAAASLVATATLSVTAVRVAVASASLSATSTLMSTAVGIGIVQATATLSATSTLSVTSVRAPQAAASLVATSTLTTIGVRVSQATVAMSVTSTLAASGVRVAQATVVLSATSTLSIVGVRMPQAAASLVATSTLAATGVATAMATIRNLGGLPIQVRHPDASWHALAPV